MTNLLLTNATANTNNTANTANAEYTFTEYFYEDYDTYIYCETKNSERYIINPNQNYISCNCSEWHEQNKNLIHKGLKCSHIKMYFNSLNINSLSEYFDYEQQQKDEEFSVSEEMEAYDSYDDYYYERYS